MGMSIVQPDKGALRVYLPYAGDNLSWLKEATKAKRFLNFDRTNRCWSVPRTKIKPLIRAGIDRYGRVSLVTEGVLDDARVCDTRCQGAFPWTVCECACAGEFHGMHSPEFVLVGASRLIRSATTTRVWERIFEQSIFIDEEIDL